MVEIKIKQTLIKAIQGDITEEQTCAIVNAANNALRGGGGVDGAIHRKGGPDILNQCLKYSGCPTGEVRTTSAGRLKAKYVIHTVGPIYHNRADEAEQLMNCYLNSLIEANRMACESIAFPSISTGVYGYPIGEASKIAVKTVVEFLMSQEHGIHLVHFVLFSGSDLAIYENQLRDFAG